MSLVDWARERSADDLQTLIDGIESGDVAEDKQDALRERLEQTDRTVREDAVAELPLIADLESVLGLRPTMPPAPTLDEDLVIEERTPDQQDAWDDVVRYANAKTTSLDELRALRDALADGTPDRAPAAVRESVRTLDQDDRDDLAEQADDAVAAQESFSEDDFPVVAAALERGPGRSTSYYRNIINELRGKRDPRTLRDQGVPDDQLDRLRERADSVRESFIEQAEAHINDLESGQQGGGRDRRSGLSGGSVFADAQDAADEARAGDDLPAGRDDQTVDVDTDYHSGEPVMRDPDFERRFRQLTRRVGWYSKFDMTNPDHYFRLTPKHQRKYYDFTPDEFLVYLLNRGEVSESGLRKRGFDVDALDDAVDRHDPGRAGSSAARSEYDPFDNQYTDDDADDSEDDDSGIPGMGLFD